MKHELHFGPEIAAIEIAHAIAAIKGGVFVRCKFKTHDDGSFTYIENRTQLATGE